MLRANLQPEVVLDIGHTIGGLVDSVGQGPADGLGLGDLAMSFMASSLRILLGLNALGGAFRYFPGHRVPHEDGGRKSDLAYLNARQRTGKRCSPICLGG